MSVYIIVNLETNKAYIGQTRGPLDIRFRQHCEYNRLKKSIITQAIRKYGKDAFYMDPLWESPGCSQEELDAKEIELIATHNTQSPNGYNITAGGGARAPAMETRTKMSESARNKFIERPELRENLSRIRSTERHSEERRRRQSETMKQKYKNDGEFREKMKRTYEERIVTEIAAEKRMSGLIRSIAEHPERFRTIYMFDEHRTLIRTFDKLADAERSGLNRGSIVRCIKHCTLFKKSMYFSYSAEPPPVPTIPA